MILGSSACGLHWVLQDPTNNPFTSYLKAAIDSVLAFCVGKSHWKCQKLTKIDVQQTHGTSRAARVFEAPPRVLSDASS